MTPGTLLAAKRGERGVTIQQAAAATRIRAEYLLRLESDELESFSGPVYARGYVTITSGRAAATFIMIDGHSLGALGVGVATREFSSQTSPQP